MFIKCEFLRIVIIRPYQFKFIYLMLILFTINSTI
ncbi:hypothetical protein pb186bvf_010687 [Paramecium bursaria]